MGSDRNKYHWEKIFGQPDTFMQEILSVHGIRIYEFDTLRKSIMDYRDKFVAHLDKKEMTKIPKLALAYLLVWAYYRKLQSDFHELQAIESLPNHLDKYFDQHLQEATKIFKKIS